MSLLQNFSVKARLYFLVLITTTMLLIVGFVGLNGLNKTNSSLKTVYNDRLVPTDQLTRITDYMQANRTELLLAMQHAPQNSLAVMHSHDIETHFQAIQVNASEISQLWQEYIATQLTAEEERLAQRYADARDRFINEGVRPVIMAMRSGQFEEANKLFLSRSVSLFDSAKEFADQLVELQQDVALDEYNLAESRYASIRNSITTLLIIAILVGFLIAFATIGSIVQVVKELNRVNSQLSQGDLTARVNYAGRDEFAEVASSVNQMGERFHDMVQKIAASSSQLAAAAEETSAITTETTNSIRRQQNETDQVATAMNEMNATVQEVARSAANAAEAASRADNEANAGKKVVAQTIDVIDSLASEVEKAASVIQNLEKDSEQIGSVLDVIRGIAEQTNLLALNAAIEAARAGEQGRGFAVVADEVRTLASRTQQSTAEIHGMIEKLQSGAANAVRAMDISRQKAQTGVEQVAQAGSSLDAITQTVANINDLNAQIASAAEEQSSVAEEINRNIVNISQVADQTNTGASQTSTASQELARLAEQLQQLVGQFRIR
jgi:methyl-accepting chemotaxis protein